VRRRIARNVRYSCRDPTGIPGAPRGGRASLFGIRAEAVALDLVNHVIFKGATVQGIYGRRMYGTWVAMTALLKAGRLDLDPLFGERLPLERLEGALETLRNGSEGKIQLQRSGVLH
jgi:threonine 3-dehydrogenase